MNLLQQLDSLLLSCCISKMMEDQGFPLENNPCSTADTILSLWAQSALWTTCMAAWQTAAKEHVASALILHTWGHEEKSESHPSSWTVRPSLPVCSSESSHNNNTWKKYICLDGTVCASDVDTRKCCGIIHKHLSKHMTPVIRPRPLQPTLLFSHTFVTQEEITSQLSHWSHSYQATRRLNKFPSWI